MKTTLTFAALSLFVVAIMTGCEKQQSTKKSDEKSASSKSNNPGLVEKAKSLLPSSKAKVDSAKLQIKEIGSRLDLYKMKKNKYPESLEEAKSLFKNQAVPKDPWGNDYVYTTSSSCGKGYELLSMGSDAKKGGDDISSCDKED